MVLKNQEPYKTSTVQKVCNINCKVLSNTKRKNLYKTKYSMTVNILDYLKEKTNRKTKTLKCITVNIYIVVNLFL